MWTKKGIIAENILPQQKFAEKLVNKLTDFYVDYFLPKLLQTALLDSLPKDSSVSLPKLYCACQKEESGKMIMCDN